MVATNYSSGSLTPTNYGTAATSKDVLLLQTESNLLLQDGIDSLLLASGGLKAVDYTKVSINASNYGPRLIKRMLLEINDGSLLLFQDGSKLFLEEIEGLPTNYTPVTLNPTDYT